MQSSKVARPLTLILAVPEELCAVYSRHEVFNRLLSVLGADNVSCVQFVPRRHVRVTFKTFAGRQAALQSGVVIDTYGLTLFEADPVSTEVCIEHLPFEVTDDVLRNALAPYGTINSVRLQKHAESEVLTGTRLVAMALTSDIPVNLRVLRYPCRVLYRGQPRPCPICRDDAHRAYSCPLRGICRRCYKPGHFARNCMSARAAQPSESSTESEDDAESEQSGEWASGDEEVVAAAAVAAPDPPMEPDPEPDLPVPVRAAESAPESAVESAPEGAAESAPKSAAESAPESAAESALVSAPESAPVPGSKKPGSKRPIENAPEPPPVPKPKRASRSTRGPVEIQSDFKWMKHYPETVRHALLRTGHTLDTHIVDEMSVNPRTHEESQIYAIFDFGRYTFRVLKDRATFEDMRFSDYRRRDDLVPVTVFPGKLGTEGPALSPDIAPSRFPVNNENNDIAD